MSTRPTTGLDFPDIDAVAPVASHYKILSGQTLHSTAYGLDMTDVNADVLVFGDGLISGIDGIGFQDAGATLLNHGVIQGIGGTGAVLVAGGLLTNSDHGTITGSVWGISLGVAGAGTNIVTNAARCIIYGGTAGGLSGANGGGGVSLAGGTLTNAGSILGGTGARGASGATPGLGGVGIDLAAAGSIDNSVGGVIHGGNGGRGANGVSPGQGGYGGNGLSLAAGGAVTNQGSIFGGTGGPGGYNNTSFSGGVGGRGGYGVTLAGAGTVMNDGLIFGGNGGAGAFASDGGNGWRGVELGTGATVVNETNATIEGGFGGHPGERGGAIMHGSGGDAIYLLPGGEGINAGTVVGGAAFSGIGDSGSYGIGAQGGAGVYLKRGTLTNEHAGVIIGGAGGNGYLAAGIGGSGVHLDGGVLTNAGAITGGSAGYCYQNEGTNGGTGGNGVYLGQGEFINRAGATVTGGGGADSGKRGYAGAGGRAVAVIDGTLTNAGTLTGGNAGTAQASIMGIYRPGGAGLRVSGNNGQATNSRTGIITGGFGSNAGLSSAAGTAGTGGAGLEIIDGETVTNAGMMFGGTGGMGLGAVGNGDGGKGAYVIGGLLANMGVIEGGEAGSAPNSAAGVGGVGVYLTDGTLVSTGIIRGGTAVAGGTGGVGVLVSGGTLSSDGSIYGGMLAHGIYSDAVSFAAAIAGRLIIGADATFHGNVAASPTADDVLELAAGGHGTVTGLGIAFSGFTTVAEDAGASWTITGDNTLISATSLTERGTIDVTGMLDAAGTVTIFGAAGTLHIVSADTANGTATLGAVTLDGGTLQFDDSALISIGSTLSESGGGTLSIENGATLIGAGSILGPVAQVAGTIVAAGGTLTLNVTEVVGGGGASGTVLIDSGSTLVAEYGLSVPVVQFAASAAGTETLVLDHPAQTTSTVVNFGEHDLIDLTNLPYKSSLKPSFLNGTLTISAGSITEATLSLASSTGTYASDNFMLQPDAKGGTDIAFVSGAMTSTFDTAPRNVPIVDWLAPAMPEFMSHLAGAAEGLWPVFWDFVLHPHV